MASDSAALFVSVEALEQFTGKKRASAQARFLAQLGLKFTQRLDGTIALRREELDAYTLSRRIAAKPVWQPDLSALDEAS
jgi:hypothetical protein